MSKFLVVVILQDVAKGDTSPYVILDHLLCRQGFTSRLRVNEQSNGFSLAEYAIEAESRSSVEIERIVVRAAVATGKKYSLVLIPIQDESFPHFFNSSAVARI